MDLEHDSDVSRHSIDMKGIYLCIFDAETKRPFKSLEGYAHGTALHIWRWPLHLCLILGEQLCRHSPHLVFWLDNGLFHPKGIQDQCSSFLALRSWSFSPSAMFGWCASPLRLVLVL